MIETPPETLAALREGRTLTWQELFNIAWHWAITEKHDKCFILDEYSDGKCRYRNIETQNACLIGAGMTDDMYSSDIEGMSITHLLRHYKDRDRFRALFPHTDRDMEFMDQLQRCHDSAARHNYYSEARQNLKYFALDNNLIISE